MIPLKGSDLEGSAQPRRGRSDPIEVSVIKTLKYSDHFGFPLTLQEIHTRLISVRVGATFMVARALKDMLKNKTIAQTDDYYHLPGRSSLVARRLKRATLSAPQLLRAQSLATRLARLPGVLAIYLTGSLAMSNSSGDSDIDFMIITQPGRLWTTRILLTLYTSLLGLRRTPHSKHNTGKLCLNLYLTPMSYSLPIHKQSLYTAYELVQAIPLYDPHSTRSALLSSNPWIHDFLPNVGERTVLKRNSRLQVEKGSPAGERTVLKVLLELIEFLAYHLQLAYMRPKITRELITPTSAFFHPHDPSPPFSKV